MTQLEARNRELETGNRELVTDYESPAERVWLPSSSAWRWAACACDMRSVIIAPAGEVIRCSHADWNSRPPAHACPLREPELPRVVGVLRGQRLRKPPRARIQRHPQRVGVDRRLAALQVHGERSRCVRLVDRIITRDVS